MSTNSRFWADWTTRDFSLARDAGALAATIAVLPLGATEQHGPHLPLKVDSALADGIVQVAATQLTPDVPALFLPTQAVGFSPEHAAFPGTLTLKAETLIRLWTDIAECVAATGVRKLVLFNTHGGHAGLLDVVARDLRARLGMLVYCVNWWALPLIDPEGRDLNEAFSAHEHRFGIHGGAIETSMMLALDAVSVEMQHAQNFASSSEARAESFAILGNGKSAKLAWQTQDYNPAGAVGDAASANAQTGQALVQVAGVSLATMLAELHRLPLSTVQGKPSF